MRHLLVSLATLALLVTSGGAVGAQEASPDPEASPTPEQLAEAEERLVTATCLGKPATIVAIAGFETVGTPGGDVIVGTPDDDVIRGEGGNDRICSGPGADTVEGGAGKDRIDGGLGDDSLDGGAGNDSINGGKGADLVTGAAGNDRLTGAAGDDTLNGGKGRDVCVGGQGTDWLPGCNDQRKTRGTVVVTKNLKLKGPHKGRFIIGKNGVTLDCDGHTVTGPGLKITMWAIELHERKRATVQNCDIRNFTNGISMEGAQGNTLRDNRVTKVNEGFTIATSPKNRFIGNEVTDARHWFAFALWNGSDRNILRRNKARGVRGEGFLLAASDRNVIEENETDGTYHGFLSHQGAKLNRFLGNVALNSSRFGINDDTAGFRGDAGTDNFYADNVCLRSGEAPSTPETLCATRSPDSEP